MKKLIVTLALGLSGSLQAQIVVGVTASSTGPGASLGKPIANAVSILPKTLGGQTVRYVLLDDATDPSVGAKAARKLAVEDKVDVIIGSSSVPVAMAQAGVSSEERLPFIALCPMAVDPVKQPFVFAIPQPIPLMVDALVEHMNTQKVKNVGFIGFADAWGDLTYNSMRDAGAPSGIKVASNERYGRADTSVIGQMLKIIGTSPDAVFVGSSGTPSALPQITAADRGFSKPFYHTHGAVNQDFIRVGGKSVEGAIAPTGPVVVAEQLSSEHPLRPQGLEFLKRYEGAYGTGARNAFAAYAWDAATIIDAAVPNALKQGKPGTPEFRKALRDAMETIKEVKGAHAVYNMSPTDHHGVDKRARVLVRVEKGEWKLIR